MKPQVTPRNKASLNTFYLVAGLAAALTAVTAVAAVSGPRVVERASERFAPPTATELGLSGQRAQRWESLRQETMALRQVGREDLIGGMTEFRGLLDQPSPDLRAFSKESQRRVDAHMAEMRSLRERQLDFYESLTPAEQARVREVVAQRIDRFAQLRARLISALEAQQ